MKYNARTWVATAAVGWFACTRRDYAMAIFQKVSAAIAAMIEVLKEDAIFETGSPWLDNYLTIAFYIALLAASSNVLRELLDAWITASKAESSSFSKTTQNPAPRKVHWRAIKLFLLLAVLIFIFVHTVRFKHRSIKLSSFRLKQEWRDVQSSLKITKDFADYLPDGGEVKLKAYQYAYGKLPDWLVKKVPGLPHDWSRGASVWSYFRLLIDESRRSWWTRQWVMGWSAWAVFVVIETVNRDHGFMVPVSYIFLGYCTSLAGMQFVFFAQLLLEPRKTLDDDGNKIEDFWVPGRWRVLGIGATEALCLVLLPTLLRWMSDASSDAASIWNLVFGFFQLVLILAPFAAAVSDEIGESNHPSTRAARKTLSHAWCILSLLSATLHLWTSISALREANSAGFFGKWKPLGWLIPWRNQYYIPKEVGRASWGVLEELGDHPWINALGWDVLLSVLGLCAWSLISSANVRDMLQCTFMPWLDDIADAMEDTIDEVQQVMEEVTSRAGTAAQSAQEAARDCANQAKQVAAPAVRKINERAKDLRDTALPVIDSMGTRVADTVGLQENVLEPILKAFSPHKRSHGSVITTIDTTSKIRSSSRRSGVHGVPQRSTSAAHSREAGRGQSPQAALRRGRSAGLPEGRLSEVVNAAAEAEAAGVTWALFVMGGLGMASAGVYGADQI